MLPRRRQYERQMLDDAQRAFAEHKICWRGEGRWYLRKCYAYGEGWESTYAAEIIAGRHGGELIVVGDIGPMIFAHGPRDARERLRWMGCCRDLGYIAQKARIGIGESASHFILDLAVEELREMAELCRAEQELDQVQLYEGVIERAREQGCSSIAEFAAIAYELDDTGDLEWASNRGVTIAPGVFYARAAVARLCDLLEAEDEQGEQRAN